jgi:ATP-dependent RNA helicase DHX57
MLENLAPQTTPEIMRTPLEGLCLQTKLLRLGGIEAFMAGLLDPPPASALRAALANLVELGALERVHGADYELTPLGAHVASLPLECGLAKALIFAAMLRCVDPVLTVVAALAERSPFRAIVPGVMDDATRAAMEAARARFAWGQSDHLAIVRAFNGWRDAGNERARRAFADDNFLSHETLRAMADARKEYAGALAEMGFLARGSGVGGGGGGGGGGGRGGGDAGVGAEANQYSGEINVIRAALVAGLSPRIVKIVAPERRYHETLSGAVAADHAARELKFFTLQDEAPEDAARGGSARGQAAPGAYELAIAARKGQLGRLSSWGAAPAAAAVAAPAAAASSAPAAAAAAAANGTGPH